MPKSLELPKCVDALITVLRISVFIARSRWQNFLAHAACGTYVGTKFHRVVRGFVAQAGDPTGTGKGGESVWGGYLPDEFHEALRHDRRGIVSMAKKAGTSNNGSQFFITLDAHPHLDRSYTIVGRVLGSETTLDAIEAVDTDDKGRPAHEIVIRKVVIHANPFAT